MFFKNVYFVEEKNNSIEVWNDVSERMRIECSLLSELFRYTIVCTDAMTVAFTFSRFFHSHYSSTGDCRRCLLLVPFLWLLFVLPWLSFFNLPCHFHPCGEVSRFLDKGNASFFTWGGRKEPLCIVMHTTDVFEAWFVFRCRRALIACGSKCII